MGLLQTLCLM
ncbi:hypothetical protein CGLO_18155 [Colletotrichum gloeosporioides Cg-14]|uniref:Uncharacterized protein n=1 Tax=Colletotrichum gloeosporioides (strain Cg-14) TaxID=1237896 RepID=T0JIK7_COLGC|nr:hypothetical protein CGLO_18155 [Colletotrichum gloeosporioides Cg-14]